MIWINQFRLSSAQPRVAQPVITDEKHPTYSNREIHTRKTRRETRNRRFFRRNASFEHSSNKPQFPLFQSHISPALSKTNSEYFKRKICSQYPVAGIVRRNPPASRPSIH